ncbi:DoxX family protein [Zophobihabitans entericus]|uniref:DoxX family protein n=1 Tax=Zophobihabitans entericus TaxID=1635327 RepID=A0A6G9IEG4_9GAMM|nr:DoxX family protein [Zophobihabitans entericus]QIQ22217.1 DoxX family protein [Zophobihabitans entericus]
MFDSKTGPFGIFLLRVVLGIMFLAHGLTKYLVFTPAGTAAFFSSIGFPGWTAYLVIAFEIFGGIMLIIGIIPRLIGLAATVQLFVAATVHFGNGWGFGNPGGGWEYPIYLSVTAFVLALLGDGAFTLVKSSSLLKLIRKS